MLVEMLSGTERRVLIPAHLEPEFYDWLAGMTRPDGGKIRQGLESVAGVPLHELARQRSRWRIEQKGVPPVYAYCNDQARVYCCLRGKDLVVLEWDQKKQNRADTARLKRAQGRAKEVQDDREQG